jgi:hypothetical protein
MLRRLNGRFPMRSRACNQPGAGQLVNRYGGDHYAKSPSYAEQFRVMAFAQLTYREGLRDIEACLSA